MQNYGKILPDYSKNGSVGFEYNDRVTNVFRSNTEFLNFINNSVGIAEFNSDGKRRTQLYEDEDTGLYDGFVGTEEELKKYESMLKITKNNVNNVFAIPDFNKKTVFRHYNYNNFIEKILILIISKSVNITKNIEEDELENYKQKNITVELRGKFDLDIILNDSKPSQSYNIFNLVSDGVEFFGTGIISNLIQDITGTLNNEVNISKNLLNEDYFILKELEKDGEEKKKIELKRFEFIDDLLDNYSDNIYLNATLYKNDRRVNI